MAALGVLAATYTVGQARFLKMCNGEHRGENRCSAAHLLCVLDDGFRIEEQKSDITEEGDAIHSGVSDPALRALQPREPPCRRDARVA